MPDEPKQGETPATEAPVLEADPQNFENLKAEFAKVQAALKEANKEAAARRKKLDEYEAKDKAKADADLTESQKAIKERDEMAKKLAALERREMQRSIGMKYGLNEALIPRLQGETPEEMEADAKALSEALPKAPKTPAINPTNPGGAATGETVAQQSARLHGSNVNAFDTETAKRLGGGVFMPTPKE